MAVLVVKKELWKSLEPGETVRVASEDKFLAEKSHGSLNLDGNCPSLSALLLGHTKAKESSGRKT